MVSSVNSFLPVRCALDIPVDCSYGSQSQYPLIGEECKCCDNCLAPAPLTFVRLQKLVQSRQVGEDREAKAVKRQERSHSQPEWQLDQKEHYQRDGYQQGKEGLQFRQH